MVIGGVRILLLVIDVGFGVFVDFLSYILTISFTYLIFYFWQLISKILKISQK